MKILNFNTITRPESLFLEIARAYNDDHKWSATVSNEIWRGRGEIISFNNENRAIMTNTFYNETVQFNIPYRLEKKWGQLLFISTNQNSYIASFEVLENEKSILKNENEFSYQKLNDRSWLQEKGSQMKMLAIFLSDEYLKKEWDWDIYIETNQFNKLILNEKCFFSISPCSENYIILETIFQKMHNNEFLKERKILINNLIKNILYTLFFPNQEFNKNNRGLIEAQRILIEDFRNQPNLATLTKIAGMNKVKFQKEFNELYGANFYQYFQKHRFEHAKKLITTLGYSVSEAAYAVGYKNLSHFSRIFVKFHHVKPSEMKEQFSSNKTTD